MLKTYSARDLSKPLQKDVVLGSNLGPVVRRISGQGGTRLDRVQVY